VRYYEERIVLICEECGERLVLLGLEDDWRSRGAIFRCECGERLSLDGGIEASVGSSAIAEF
jgi:hypothetical protein